MYEDYLRTVLRIEVKNTPAPTHDAPAELEGAQYSGPGEVDGDDASATVRREAAARARTAVTGGSGAANSFGHVQTYRKDESDDPYVNVGRNEPCPCGSGKKFKNCHGRNR